MLALLPLLGPILEKALNLIPDPTERARALAQAQTEMLTALQGSDTAQGQVNANEAQNPNLFVSGWRPAAGWTCVFALVYDLILRPLVPFTMAVSGVSDIPVLPALSDDLWPLLFGMLGLGALRSYDKKIGTTR